MEMSSFRKRILNGEVHLERREALIKEYEYFISIAPKSPFEKLSLSKFKDLPQEKKILCLVLLLIFAPIWMPMIPMLIIVMVCVLALSRGNRSPEYEAYDYKKNIAEPVLKLFDEKMEMRNYLDPHDLVDADVYYSQALVDAYLINPPKNNATFDYLSFGSYNWKDASDPDSFDFSGYKVYHEYEDSDGDTHETVYFNGCIFKFHLSFTIDGTVNIMSTTTTKGLLGREKERNRFKEIKNKDIEVIDTENHAFAEQFDTIATYDKDAYRYLTPTMIENLLMLRQHYYFAICIKGNVLTIAIDNGGYKGASQLSFGSITKPSFGSGDPTTFINSRTDSVRQALISIYELRDLICF